MAETTQERIEQVLGSLRALVEDLSREAWEKTAKAEEEASVSVARYADASDELDSARRQIERFQAERETLPNRAYRAGLDEDYELEDELKALYKSLKTELEALPERVARLEAEIAGLVGKNPTPSGHLDVLIHSHERVRDTYDEAAAPLIEIKRQVVALLSDAVDPLVAEHRATGQSLMGLRDQRAGDPAVRQRSLEKRGIRPEFVGAKPKPGI